MNRQVVVTGLGVISPIGTGKKLFWANLIKGTSGVDKVTLFDTSTFNRHYGGEVKDFSAERFISPEMIPFVGRASQFAIAATEFALKDASLTQKSIQKNKNAIIIGTTMAEASVIDFSGGMFIKKEWDKITSKLIVNSFAPSIPRNVGHFLKIKGENVLIPNACAAGNYALSYGYDLIRQGKIDYAIVGGAEALSRVAFQGFQRLYAMGLDVCTPFDKERKGMILGEGAGILILESLEHARARHAHMYAEVLGYGLSCDAHHMTIPKKEGVRKAMSKALINSGLSPKDIDYISAHGTGTQANDKNESAAINEVFENRRVPVSSIKSMLGHTMGAASAIESITCCMALEHQVVPPTMNYQTPDPECDIDCVPNKSRKMELTKVLNNGIAFGGNNCCVVLGKIEADRRG
ncbi:MAG: beta-ketoacyl-[acyl-carrier-protein] synthase family protein [Candidatus Omnitrophica bacterium]|nr:beta-ketoacyl-[acyl-carrier-protein] synthase family protein [Candidatus Omnitrophota bacterium]